MKSLVPKIQEWSSHCEGFIRSNLLIERLLNLTKNIGTTNSGNQKLVIIREGIIA